MITRYNIFLYEGITDKMIGISEDEEFFALKKAHGELLDKIMGLYQGITKKEALKFISDYWKTISWSLTHGKSVYTVYRDFESLLHSRFGEEKMFPMSEGLTDHMKSKPDDELTIKVRELLGLTGDKLIVKTHKIEPKYWDYFEKKFNVKINPFNEYYVTIEGKHLDIYNIINVLYSCNYNNMDIKNVILKILIEVK